jgi:hypothetical protein
VINKQGSLKQNQFGEDQSEINKNKNKKNSGNKSLLRQSTSLKENDDSD